MTGQPDFFTETSVTLEQKVEKSFPRWEMNGLSEGYKRATDQNWGGMAKIRFFGQKQRFWAQKKDSIHIDNISTGAATTTPINTTTTTTTSTKGIIRVAFFFLAARAALFLHL